MPTLTNQVLGTYDSQPGDSGGLIYTSSNLNRVGVHVGRSGGDAIFTTAQNANSNMGLSNY